MARHLSKAHGKRKAVGGLAAVVVLAVTVTAALVPSASAIVQPPDIGSATWNATWDPAAAWPPAADPGAWPVPAANPNLTPRCGLDFGVIVDRSGSIFDAGQATAYRDGLNSLIDAFADTPSNLGLWSFANDASDTDAVTYPWHQMADLSDPTNVDSLHDTVNSIPVQTGFTTSWEEGLRAPLQASVDASPEPELWVVVTDGQPTVHAHDSGTGHITNNDDMAGGIASANLLKASDGGTKVLAVGVGPGVSEAGLQLISGPTEFDPTAGNFVTADYITTSFADLASNLEDFALRLCGSSVTVTKEVSTVAAPTTYAAAPGWTFTATNNTAPPAVTPASDLTDGNGQIEFTWSSPVTETVTITETQQASFQLTSRTCTLNGAPFPFTETADGAQLSLAQGQHVSCTFRNQPVFTDLSVTKTDGKTTTEPGATNSYVITATNAADATATATDVILTETVPDNATYESSGSAAWSCADESVAGTVCTINVGSLAPGASANRTFNVEVINPVGAGVSNITNTVTVTGTGNERDTGDQTATDVDTLTAAPDLTVVKDDGGVTAEPGDEVTYAIEYANVGNRDATGVVLTETVPAGSTFVGPDGWTCVDTTCTFEVGVLAAGDSGSVDFTVQVVDPFPEAQTELDNVVVIDDDGENGDDPTPENNTADDQTPVALLEITVFEPECDGDVPYLTYAADVTNLPGASVTITWINPDGDDVVMEDLPLEGRVLWPGAVVDENGDPLDWPGWTLEPDGTWTEGDEFDWVRPSVSVLFQVNPEETLEVAYPPATPTCDANPPEVLPNAEDPPAAVAGNVVLPVTGQEVNGLLALAGLLLILGVFAAAASPAVAKRRRGYAAQHKA